MQTVNMISFQSYQLVLDVYNVRGGKKKTAFMTLNYENNT